MAFSSYSCKIAVLKYSHGDWYANPTSLNNLIQFCQTNLIININPIYDVVDVESPELFRYLYYRTVMEMLYSQYLNQKI